MPFEKGISGNPAGRPKGALNKASDNLRENISDFLTDNFQEVVKEFRTMKGKDKVKFFSDLLQYAVPKMQATSFSIEQLNDQQLDELYDRIVNQSK